MCLEDSKTYQFVHKLRSEKMKLLVLLFAVITIASSGVIDNTIGLETAEVEANYKQGLKKMETYLNENVHSEAGRLFGIVKRSIDVGCAAEKVKKYKLADKLADLISNEAEFTKRQGKEFGYIMARPLQACSTISRAVGKTIFDMLMSFGHIVRAFKDEPELAEYMVFVKCLNNYAVEKKLIDPEIYPLNYIYTEEEDKAECDGMKEGFWEGVNEDLESQEACTKEAVTETLNLIIKDVLLTQVRLTSEQHQTEFDYFYNQFDEITDKYGACGFEELMEDSAEAEDIVASLGQLKGLASEMGVNV